MTTPHKILVIEDKVRQFTPIRDDLEEAGWVVERAEDEHRRGEGWNWPKQTATLSMLSCWTWASLQRWITRLE